MIRDYNVSMSGIDRMLSHHFSLRKALRRYKKADVYHLETFLTNAFYLYRKFGVISKNVSYLVEFREAIMKGLIDQRKMKVTKIYSKILLSGFRQQGEKNNNKKV